MNDHILTFDIINNFNDGYFGIFIKMLGGDSFISVSKVDCVYLIKFYYAYDNDIYQCKIKYQDDSEYRHKHIYFE